MLGLAQSGLPRLRVATLRSLEHRELATHARAWAERLLDDAGPAGRARRRLAAELAGRAGCAASTPATPRAPPTWPTRAGSSPGPRAACGWPPPGPGTRPAHRPGQADAVRDPRAGARRGRASSTCSPAAGRAPSRRCRGGAASAVLVERGRRRGAGHRREPAPDEAGGRGRAWSRRDAIAWLADAASPPDARFDLVLVDPPYEDTAALVRALELVGAARRRGRQRRREALLARRPAGAGRYAGDRARAAVRRDGADVLPAEAVTKRRRARREDRGLSRVLRPHHRTATSTSCGVPSRVFDKVVVAVLGNPRKAPLLDAGDAGRDHPRRARRRTPRSPGASTWRRSTA